MADQAGPVVVLTRAPEDNAAVASALRARGVEVREIPCVSFQYLDPGPLPHPVGAVAFTSRRGVRGLARLEHGLEWLERASAVAAVGPGTARELEAMGIEVGIVADPPEGRVLAGEISERLPWDLPLSCVAGDLTSARGLEATLTEMGRAFTKVTVYRNLAPHVPALPRFPVAGVLVASPSAARRLLGAMPWMAEARFVSLGPTTSDALSQFGVGSVVQVDAREPGSWVQALLDAHREASATAGRRSATE